MKGFLSLASLCCALVFAFTLGGSPAWAQGVQMPFLDFDGPALPVNKEGVGYPTQYSSSSEGGQHQFAIDTSKKVAGNGSLRVRLLSGHELYIQWNPWDGVGRDFARIYASDPAAWTFNTFNRMKFWFFVPTTAASASTNGQHNYYLGTYVKRVTNASRSSDEEGGGHFYHPFNVRTGEWSMCVLNSHPGHERGQNGGTDSGNVLYPTSGDPARTYNYFDALTRFYIQETPGTSVFPRDYWLDEMSFYQETRPENDEQVYSICASATPANNRIFLTWNRLKSENDVRHEVRYAFSDIHTMGWDNATPAPSGTVTPPGWQGYNGMVYDTNKIDISGRSMIYLAIKPQNSGVFSQIALPLDDTAKDAPSPSGMVAPNPPGSVSVD